MDKEKKDKKTTPVHVVVQTVSGLEDELEMFIKDRVKGDAAGEIFIPKRQINVKKDGKWSVKTEIMFPGYVFRVEFYSTTVALCRNPSTNSCT